MDGKIECKFMPEVSALEHHRMLIIIIIIGNDNIFT